MALIDATRRTGEGARDGDVLWLGGEVGDEDQAQCRPHHSHQTVDNLQVSRNSILTFPAALSVAADAVKVHAALPARRAKRRLTNIHLQPASPFALCMID